MRMHKDVQTAIIYKHLMDSFNAESGVQPTLVWEETDETFFSSALEALALFYSELTNSEPDIIDFFGILNRLMIQGLVGSTGVCDPSQKPCSGCKHAHEGYTGANPVCLGCEEYACFEQRG